MLRNILKKIIVLLLVLVGVSFLVFLFNNISSVDSAYALAIRRFTYPTAEQVKSIREELGLNKPLLAQFASWLLNVAQGNFGNSYNTGRPIIVELRAAMPPTFTLACLSLLFAIVITVPVAILSARKRGKAIDKIIYFGGIAGMSVPNYWIGFLLLLAFAVNIPIFSVFGTGSIVDSILPALALAIPIAASSIRVFRSSLLSEYSSDYVMYARARGVSEAKISFIVMKHGLPPIITMLAQSFGSILAGSSMIESVFSIAGIGSMLVTALNARDTITVSACVFFLAFIFVITNFIADIINIILNPRFAEKEGENGKKTIA